MIMLADDYLFFKYLFQELAKCFVYKLLDGNSDRAFLIITKYSIENTLCFEHLSDHQTSGF